MGGNRTLPLAAVLKQCVASLDDASGAELVRGLDLDGTTPLIEVLRACATSLEGSSALPPSVSLKPPGAGRVVEFQQQQQNDIAADSNDSKEEEDDDSPPQRWVSPAAGIGPETRWEATRLEAADGILRKDLETPAGAKVAIACLRDPARLSGEVWVHCHGHRAEGSALVAEGLESPLEPVWASLIVEHGALIASTSYRRTGRCVRDGVADAVDAARLAQAELAALGVRPNRTFLEGRSMGGAIATYAIELHPDLFSGAVCIGAALLVQDDPTADDASDGDTSHLMEFSHSPTRPILFLTNASELSYIQRYIDSVQNQHAALGLTSEIYVPALWTVWREGHNLVSAEERATAAQALRSWVRDDTFITRRFQNVFLPSAAQAVATRPPLVLQQNGDGQKSTALQTSVRSIHPVFNSFTLHVSPHDLEEVLGIQFGAKFCLRVADHDPLEVLVTSYPFAGCHPGDWVAFEDPDSGLLVVSIFGWYEAATPAIDAHVEVGTKVSVERRAAPKREG